MKSNLETIIGKNNLQLEYNRAKIKANPYDYKFTDKLIIINDDEKFRQNLIYNKNMSSENQIFDMLEISGNNKDYLTVNSQIYIKDIDTKDLPTTDLYVWGVGDSNLGILNKYNNLYVNENHLHTNTLVYKSHFTELEDLYNFKVFECLEVIFTRLTSQNSIIPYLMYLSSELKNESLDDLYNLTTFKNIIKIDKSVPQYNGNSSYDKVTSDNYFINYVRPGYVEGIATSFIGTPFLENSLRVSLCLSMTYLMEVLYHLEELIKDYPLFISELNYSSIASDHIGKYFYEIVNHELIINPELKACFVNNNITRYENFRTYFFKILTKELHYIRYGYLLDTYAKFPIILADLLASCHQYAYQQFRVNNILCLCEICKELKINLLKNFEIEVSDYGLAIPGISNEEDSNELLDLSTCNYTSKALGGEDNLTNAKRPVGTTLDSLDKVKHELQNNKYTFDINCINSNDKDMISYIETSKNVKFLTACLTKQIKEIKTYNTDGKNAGQESGKLDMKNIWKYKTTSKIFCNNSYKLKEMDLAFGCILDESGSMSGKNIQNGRIVMIMLHEVLQSLGINHSIVGHTSYRNHHCEINKYYHFKEDPKHSLQKPYALASITSKNGNCDSGALFYMQQAMKVVRNKDKIVIIFSDGYPTECTSTELKNQIRDMEKQGIHVIGVGIDFDAISEYYNDCANGKNLKEMLDITVSILKRYVLEKKD